VVDYGDGVVGTDPGNPHTYAAAGTFTAGFTVSTAAQSARCSTVIQVSPAPTPSPTPTPVGENQPPDAVFRTTPEAAPGRIIRGVVPLSVRFNMCATTDPERDPRRYKMDFDGNGDYEVDGSTGGDCRRSYTYRFDGRYSPELCVTDIDASSRAPLHRFQCRTYSVRVSLPPAAR
jgi:PKD repeat protein